jgi:hypothetical protein
MATNARLQITDLDFDTIKTNLKTYLQQQTEFTDYNFEGSGLNVLLDVLAYNTHYNAYYLNMVANEAFLDTALLRDSVVSHAKTLSYIPYSYSAPKAIVNIVVTALNNTPATLTVAKGTTFSSNLIDNISYNFVTLEDVTVTKSDTKFFLDNVELYEGKLVSYNFNYNKNSNPKSIFVLPDANIDTNTIYVTVSDTVGNTATQVYNQVTEILDVDSTSLVYFLQESKNGNYEIYFGDGIIGAALTDGALVNVNYLTTNGTAANGVDGFVADTPLGGSTNIAIEVLDVASGGAIRESVDSIKYSAAAQYANQNRLVTVKDYESYIKSKYPSIDSLSVWGGETESIPVYGKVYIALKPKTNYFISELEKARIISEIIGPKSIVSVQAEIRDPEYLFLLIESSVQYDPRKTVSTEDAIKTAIRNAIISYQTTNLNKFGASFVLSKLQDNIDQTDLNSIIGSETTVRVQRRFTPQLNTSASYNIKFNVPLHRGTITNKLTSSQFTVFDSTGTIRTAQFDETPQSFTGISEIQVANPGSGYTTSPTVTINGDGSNATAEATIVNGRIQKITVTNRGIEYTQAIVTISGGDGFGAEALAVIDAKVGTLRTIYYDSLAQRQIINADAGKIYYDTGIVVINDIRFLTIDSTDELIRMTIEAEKGIIETNRNTIITIDTTDPAAIVTTLTTNNKQ